MSTQSRSRRWNELPLRDAYKFGIDRGLGTEISDIRNRDMGPHAAPQRRSLIAKLFKSRRILDEFIGQCWQYGNTAEGQIVIPGYLPD